MVRSSLCYECEPLSTHHKHRPRCSTLCSSPTFDWPFVRHLTSVPLLPDVVLPRSLSPECRLSVRLRRALHSLHFLLIIQAEPFKFNSVNSLSDVTKLNTVAMDDNILRYVTLIIVASYKTTCYILLSQWAMHFLRHILWSCSRDDTSMGWVCSLGL